MFWNEIDNKRDKNRQPRVWPPDESKGKELLNPNIVEAAILVVPFIVSMFLKGNLHFLLCTVLSRLFLGLMMRINFGDVQGNLWTLNLQFVLGVACAGF